MARVLKLSYLKLTNPSKPNLRKHQSFIKLIQVIVAMIHISYVYGYATKEQGIIYMLIWTTVTEMPFRIMQHGRHGFLQRNCTFNNCFVTDQRAFFYDLLDFDVILFSAMGIRDEFKLPHVRSEHQKYILLGLEPAGIHKLPSELNKFFNTTWTYKLDSDVLFPYIVVKDEHGVKIGPKTDMHWIDIKDMNETTKYVKDKLRKKRIAAAMFVSNCVAPNERLKFAGELREELANYNQRVDVFGACGDRSCDRDDEECYALIETNYYFYLAFENSFGEDYVTEKLLTGLEHFAVPVVYGTANYTRFMPTGIYLNALALGPVKLAQKMLEAIYNKDKYYDYFKWHGHYSFHYTGENDFHDEICGLCEFVNNKTVMNRKVVRTTNIWWNEWHRGPPQPDDNYLKLLIDDDTSAMGNIYNFLFER